MPSAAVRTAADGGGTEAVYICHCRGVTDREIRAAIDDGASTIADLSRMCDAGGRCRGCWPALTELLAEIDRAPEERLVSMLQT